MHLAHVILLVHLERATIHDLLDGGFVRPRVVPIIVNVVINLVRKLMAFLEALMVRADKNHAQIHLSEADVDMKHVLLGAPRDADRCPSFAVSHRTQSHHEVENDSHVYEHRQNTD